MPAGRSGVGYQHESRYAVASLEMVLSEWGR
eukprot:COSAG01_NODE_50851_length_359_cov_10.330769_1_plen_30_part_01